MTISETVLPLFIHWLPILLTGMAVFFAFWLLAYFVHQLISKVANRSNPNKAYILNWLGQFAKIALIIVGLIMAAASMGINVSALIASLGFTGVAVGLALKEPLANTLSGAIVLVNPPFHVGDFIKVTDKISTFEGEVFAINMRYTFLMNCGEEMLGEKILIPNIILLTCPIIIREHNKDKKKVEIIAKPSKPTREKHHELNNS